MQRIPQKTLPLFTYQAEAADIMAGRDRYGLHDVMGIGKTATTIGAINRIKGRRGIIVAPAILRENWLQEFRKFSTYPLSVCKGKTYHDYVAWSRGRFDVLVTSYELATKWRKDFTERVCEPLDFIAFDEAHYLKNIKANRTVQLLGSNADGKECITSWAAHAWHITGTPMANDPTDIYSFLRFAKAFDLSPDEFNKLFLHVDINAYGIRSSVKPSMTKTLQELIRNNSIRRDHADVGMQLPPVWLREVVVDGDLKDIKDLLREHPALDKIIIDALDKGGLSHLDSNHIATLRRLVGKSKAIPYALMLKEEMDAGAGKRVVFGLHTEALEYVHRTMNENGHDFVLVNGSTKERDRVEAVRRFQEDPNCVGFIGNIKVAGVGLTLTASGDIDMLESDWTPAGNAQALKRVHRYGQTKNVTARFITLANSVDEQVNRIVADKTAAIAEIERN
jgi:SWI/SNF-related matrix-associated actin-dependent regulator of chromatin subfamily A-like protein 1